MPELPEEFAPTGPKLTRFPLRPAPPVLPRLFPDEARFALRLAVLAGGAELALWAALPLLWRPGRSMPWVLGLFALRLLRPAWAWAGQRVPRPLLAFGLLFLALLGDALWLGGVRLAWLPLLLAAPAVGDLCATCIADSVTVERRSAAYAWLDMGQGLGAALGLALGALGYGALAAIPALLAASVGVMDLKDRGTPRSAWPLRSYLSALRQPLPLQLVVLSVLCAALAPRFGSGWLTAAAPLLGMAVAARLEPLMPNAVWLPRLAVALGVASRVLGMPWLGALGLGVAFAAVPASVARGAGELERPLVSSLCFLALAAGAALSAML